MAIITTEGLSKSYGESKVLSNMSFSLPEGEVIGLFGPNGCGKTTFMKILTGLIHDYSGSVLINGEKPGEKTKSFTAYLPEQTFVHDWMRNIDAVERKTTFCRRNRLSFWYDRCDSILSFKNIKHADKIEIYRNNNLSEVKEYKENILSNKNFELIVKEERILETFEVRLYGVKEFDYIDYKEHIVDIMSKWQKGALTKGFKYLKIKKNINDKTLCYKTIKKTSLNKNISHN